MQEHESGPSQRLFGTLLIAVGVTVAAVAWRPWLFMVDDAWFYLQIGRNIALGLGSTFDTIYPTDGYHPLWMGVVALVGWITGGSRSAMFSGTVLLQIVVVLGTVFGLRRLGTRLALPFPEFAVLALLFTQYADKGWGSEGPLAIALHVAVLLAWTAHRPLLTGLLLGSLFLARLDTVFFVLAVLALARKEDRLALLAGAALVASPWVLWHAWTTGHLVPVSGSLKSTFPIPDLSNPWYKLGPTGTFALLGSVATVLASRSATGDPRRVWLALGAGGMLHGTYTVGFTGADWSTNVAYYWVTGVLATGLGLGHWANRYLALLPSLPPATGRLLIHLSIGVLAGVASTRAMKGAITVENDPTIDLAEYIKVRLRVDDRILALDAPGRLAWYGQRIVIAGDGLTQEHGFSDALRQDAEGWLQSRQITHLLAYDRPFDGPWCNVTTNPVEVTLRAPDTREPVFTFRPTERRVDLSGFDRSGGPNEATLYRWRP